ncbi:MAG: metallophosphoesterase [Thermodesulfobacteriaceae bacterium]|nr:metallophosphoesterase [Thermodesulfobacteriaceae bacterium]
MRYADKNFPPQITFFIAFLALFGMGFILYLTFFTLILEIYRIWVKFYKKSPFSTPKDFLFFTFFSSLALSLYSHYETYKLEVVKIKIQTSKLPSHLSSFKILHLSDLHLGPVMGLKQINMVKEVYLKEKPDLVLSTGDLVDGNMKNRLHLAYALKELSPPYGKFAIVGNHEYYRGIAQAIEFTERANFKVLKGESITIENWLTLVGLDDEDCKFFKACHGPLDELELLKKESPSHFKILLKHKPKVNYEAVGHFDLMLSGHTHGGLYYPFGKWIVSKIFKFKNQFEYLGEGSYVIVSKGVGTGGPPMRFLSPPDVVIIEILRNP